MGNTILEAKGEFPSDRFSANCKVMDDLWNEIAQLADFDKNGEVDVDEFKAAVQVNYVGKSYDQFPPMFKTFIENQFKAIDINSDPLSQVHSLDGSDRPPAKAPNSNNQDIITQLSNQEYSSMTKHWDSIDLESSNSALEDSTPVYE